MKKPRNYHALNAIQRHAGPMKKKQNLSTDWMEDDIPHGPYCYDENGICPWWRQDTSKPKQENGYCLYLKVGDWDLPIGLLWDQCKECCVNMEFSEE